MSFVSLICGILTLVASWMIFKKMGHQGWEGIVPFYNTYVLCQELYGSGWKFLLLLIPLYNIYFIIKMQIDLAKAFNQGAGFGIGLLLLPFIFQMILGFGSAQYRDGAQANTQPDMVEDVVNKAKDAVSGSHNDQNQEFSSLIKKLAVRRDCQLFYFFSRRLIMPNSMSISPSSSRRIPSSAF